VTDYVSNRFGWIGSGATEELAIEAAARLGIDGWRRWPAGERLFWERWAPLVALLPGLDDWPTTEKRDLAAVIRAKGGRGSVITWGASTLTPASAPRSCRSRMEKGDCHHSRNGDSHLMTSAVCLRAAGMTRAGTSLTSACAAIRISRPSRAASA